MDTLQSHALKASVSQERLKLDIISGTLDALNSPSTHKASDTQDAVSESYQFQKSVLSSVYEAKGGILDAKK